MTAPGDGAFSDCSKPIRRSSRDDSLAQQATTTYLAPDAP